MLLDAELYSGRSTAVPPAHGVSHRPGPVDTDSERASVRAAVLGAPWRRDSDRIGRALISLIWAAISSSTAIFKERRHHSPTLSMSAPVKSKRN